MNLEFIGQNVHFAVNLLASLAMFAVFWLTFDAWLERRKLVEGVKWAGFLSLALGFLLNGSVIDQLSNSAQSWTHVLPIISTILRIVGYSSVFAAQLAEPLMKRPDTTNELEAAFKPSAQVVKQKKDSVRLVWGASTVKSIILPLLPLAIAVMYWRRSTVGLERHLRPVGVAFTGLALFEALTAVTSLQSTANPNIYNVIQTYGPIWWTAQVLLLASAYVFGNWVWRYLSKRLLSQIFIVLVTATVALYFLSTVGFSFLLLGNSRQQALTDLSTASHVLDYAVTSATAQLQAEAEAAALRPYLAEAAANNDHIKVVNTVGDFVQTHHVNILIVTNADGKVLLRSDDPDRWGDSLSENTLVQRALVGRAVSSIITQNGVVAPDVLLVSAQPLRDSKGFIVGSVQVYRSIGSAFVDSIKSSTGLDSSVYGNSRRSATTLKSSDNLHRAVGVSETNSEVLDQVLKKGNSFAGETSYANQLYLAAYAPLVDADNNKVGMLLVARPAAQLFAAATKSTELAFLTAIGLLMLSVAPVYLLSKKISGDVR